MPLAAINVSSLGLANAGLPSPSRHSPVAYSPLTRLPAGFGTPDPWSCLPNDIAWLVFKRVVECSDGGKHSDLGSARLVCRSWAVQGASAVMTLKPTAKPLPGSQWSCKFANLRMIDLSGSARFVLGQPSNPLRRLFHKLKSGSCFAAKIHPHFHEQLSELQGLEHLVSGSEKPVSSHAVAALALLPHLKDLDFTGSIISDDGLFQIRGLSSLMSLQLEGCGRLQPHIMTSALRGLSSLTQLNLKGCCKGVTNGLVANLSCPKLKSFNVHGCDKLTESGLSHLSRFKELEELDVGGIQAVTDKTVKGTLAALTSLRSLNVSWCKCMTDDGLGALSVLTGLRDLSISFCHRITNSGLEDLLRIDHANGCTEPMPYLETLNMGWNFKVSDEGLEYVARCPKLSTLNIDSCSVADSGMATLSKATTLTDLDLSNLSNLTDMGLEQLNKLTGLRRLGVKWCSRLTDDGMLFLTPLTDLEYVDLRCCVMLTDSGVEVLRSIPSLTRMDLRLCNKLSKEAVASLGSRFVPYE